MLAPARLKAVMDLAVQGGAVGQPLGRQRFERGEFAADVIDRPGLADRARQFAQQIQIGQPRLDHQDVGALGGIALGAQPGVAGARRIELVAGPILEPLRHALGAESAATRNGP